MVANAGDSRCVLSRKGQVLFLCLLCFATWNIIPLLLANWVLCMFSNSSPLHICSWFHTVQHFKYFVWMVKEHTIRWTNNNTSRWPIVPMNFFDIWTACDLKRVRYEFYVHHLIGTHQVCWNAISYILLFHNLIACEVHLSVLFSILSPTPHHTPTQKSNKFPLQSWCEGESIPWSLASTARAKPTWLFP